MDVDTLPTRLMSLYRRLQEQALAERASSQVWHEADIEGHHLYMADTSFGDGPIFRFDQYGWEVIDAEPYTIYTSADHLERALSFAERAEWVSRFKKLADGIWPAGTEGLPPRD